MALVLVQSLRDVGTDMSVDIVVMLFRGGTPSQQCERGTWRLDHGRNNVRCGGPDSLPEEIIDPALVSAFRRLGALVVVLPPVERYEHTRNVPGGESSFWGMALNKLVVFKMMQYKKVIFMDGDTLFFRNIDHLWQLPTFTSSITYACCNNNGPAIPSGGLWVLEPSVELWNLIDHQMRMGDPVYDMEGRPVLDDKGQQKYEEWRLGDMAIVREVFCSWDRNHLRDRLCVGGCCWMGWGRAGGQAAPRRAHLSPHARTLATPPLPTRTHTSSLLASSPIQVAVDC